MCNSVDYKVAEVFAANCDVRLCDCWILTGSDDSDFSHSGAIELRVVASAKQDYCE